MLMKGSGSSSGPPVYCYDSWTYHKSLNGNTTSGGANITDNLGGGTITTGFPIAIHINSTSWPTSTDRTHFFNDTYNPLGKRVRFCATDRSTVLNYEVEYYDTASQEAIYWVSVPTITGNNANSNMVYVAYGNDPNSSNQDNKTGVWDSNYVMVQHLGNNSWGSSPEAKDSTSNVINGTNTSSTDVAAAINRGRTFNGSAYISLGSTSLLNLYGAVSMSFWMKTSTQTSYMTMFAKGMGPDVWTGYELSLSSHKLRCSGLSFDKVGTTTIDDNTLRHVGATFDGTNLKLYVNGANDGSTTGTTGSDSQNAYIGRRGDNSQYKYIGSLDEVRISNIGRSASWIKLEYYSMKKTNWNGDAWITWNAEQ